MEIVLVVVGIGVGVTVTWLLTSRRTNALISEKGRVEERARLQEESLQRANEDLRGERNKVLTLSEEIGRAQSESTNLLEKLNSQKEEIEALQEKLTERFQNIATKILTDNSQLIQQQHKQKLEDVLNPLKERIQEFEKKVDATREQSVRDSQSLKEQISVLHGLNQTLGEEAKNLTTALKGQSKTQGTWGELILESLLEKSGLTKGREYIVHEISTGEDGRRYYPDVIIRLPENKKVIIDSKLSLIAYERFCNAEDKVQRDAALKEHIGSIKKHIRELSAKNYQNVNDDVLSLDFVLMFIPIEPAFSVVVSTDMTLFNEALEKNIVLVTPSTLLATLRTIASMWKLEKQNRNAQEIAKESGGLYDKLAGLLSDLVELGNRIKQAQSSYDETIKKLSTGSGNLLARVENIKQLGAKTTKTLPAQFRSVETTEQMTLIE